MSQTENVSPPLQGWKNSVESIIATAQHFRERKKVLPLAKFTAEVQLQYGLSITSANKLIRLAKHPIISNPQNFSKLPPRWALLYEFSFLDENKLNQLMANGAALASKYDVWKERKHRTKLRKDGVIAYSEYRSSIKGPSEDLSLTEHCRLGMEMEKQGVTMPEAAKKIGMGYASYTQIKNILALSDRKDLSEADSMEVEEIINQVNRTRNVRRYYQRIKPIIERVWGTAKVSKTGRAADRRLDAFKNAVGVVHHACQKALNLDSPYLSEEDAKSLLMELNEARRAITKLMDNLRKANDD